MLIEERKELWQKARSTQMQQHFFLPHIPPSVRLTFEPLSYENGMQLFDMFENDDNPFVDDRFKSVEETEDYLACMLEYAQFSGKRAAFDWLLRLKTTGAYMGVLHLHDLSKYTFANAHLKATIGYAIAQKYRNQGFAREAINHFTPFLFAHSNKTKLLVYTSKQNLDSIKLMKNLNWQQNDDKYVYSDQYAYFELHKE